MIKIENAGCGRPVPLNSLQVGDTFLHHGVVCMIANRNHHPFVLSLNNGEDEWAINLDTTSLLVIPVECKLSYQIK